jgi:hypothetical protein
MLVMVLISNTGNAGGDNEGADNSNGDENNGSENGDDTNLENGDDFLNDLINFLGNYSNQIIILTVCSLSVIIIILKKKKGNHLKKYKFNPDFDFD